MSSYPDPLTFPVLDVPAIWRPEKEKVIGNPLATSIEEQAKASLLASAGTVEAMLRLLHGETAIDRVFEPPQGYNPDVQGEWDDEAMTSAFHRRVEKIREIRDDESLLLGNPIERFGSYRVEITPERFSIEKEKKASVKVEHGTPVKQ